jgi:hypothetical protein
MEELEHAWRRLHSKGKIDEGLGTEPGPPWLRAGHLLRLATYQLEPTIYSASMKAREVRALCLLAIGACEQAPAFKVDELAAFARALACGSRAPRLDDATRAELTRRLERLLPGSRVT